MGADRIDDFESGDHRFLSNFYAFAGHRTVEHYYQAAKTDEPQHVAMILAAATPGLAKRLGRAAPMRPTWEQEKKAVMLTLLRMKFARPEMGALLLATGEAELVEGNTWGDVF